ncbi:hypothetical protein CRG98_015837 [Punica granatum]|uniref:Uncharacterized protein n=1 Tax=Punica granatum TaxID=22663 RepID=A0A2I0K5E9_PUNGR|nr:hypothetical protein CRG98_015837 [Punica granatum]
MLASTSSSKPIICDTFFLIKFFHIDLDSSRSASNNRWFEGNNPRCPIAFLLVPIDMHAQGIEFGDYLLEPLLQPPDFLIQSAMCNASSSSVVGQF